jgi:hypothetical protein
MARGSLTAAEFSGGIEAAVARLRDLGFAVVDTSPERRAGTPKNPAWTQDEVILALDLYLRHRPHPSWSDHSDVVELSRVLNALPICSNCHSMLHHRRPWAGPRGASRRDSYGERTELARVLRCIHRCTDRLARIDPFIPSGGIPSHPNANLIALRWLQRPLRALRTCVGCRPVGEARGLDMLVVLHAISR